MSDLVSVVIPTHNREGIIKKSIVSVLNSTYSNIEVIVVDDGSVDNTREIVESIADSRVHYIYQANAGACAARNNGIKHARGSYIAFNDSDDEWYEDKLEKQLNIFKDNDADVVVCLLDTQAIESNDAFEDITKTAKIIGKSTQTFICKKDVFNDTMFDDEMPRMQDFDFLIRAMEYHKIYCVNQKLVKVNSQYDSISKNSTKLINALELMNTKYSVFLPKYEWLRIRIAELWRHAAKESYKQGNKNYRDCYKKSLRVYRLRSSEIMLFLSYTSLIKVVFALKKDE